MKIGNENVLTTGSVILQSPGSDTIVAKHWLRKMFYLISQYSQFSLRTNNDVFNGLGASLRSYLNLMHIWNWNLLRTLIFFFQFFTSGSENLNLYTYSGYYLSILETFQYWILYAEVFSSLYYSWRSCLWTRANAHYGNQVGLWFDNGRYIKLKTRGSSPTTESSCPKIL